MLKNSSELCLQVYLTIYNRLPQLVLSSQVLRNAKNYFDRKEKDFSKVGFFAVDENSFVVVLDQPVYLLKEDGMIIFEHSSNMKYDYSQTLNLVDSKKYGYITVDYLEYCHDQSNKY